MVKNMADLTTTKLISLANLTAFQTLNKAYIDNGDKGVENALKAIIGTPVEGKTIVQMINDAQTAATYDDTQVKKDIADFTPMIATYYYSNTPGQSSSTWVRQVTFNPRMNNIRINRKYDCPANRTVLRLMMSSKSLGRYFNRHFRLR